MKRRVSSFRRNDSGATAALYALALPALVAVAGIAFDYSRLASMDTELQNAADQAALAAATQLDGRLGGCARAASAASSLVSNITLFANDGQGSLVVIAEETGCDAVGAVRFWQTVDLEGNGVLAATSDANAKYVQIVLAERTANYALTPVVGALSDDIVAAATAGTGSALCRTPPLMLCNPNEPAGGNANADFNANAYRGVGLLTKGGGGSSWVPGNFGYVDTFPGTGGGTPDLIKAFAWNTTPGNCISRSGNTTVDTETGNHASVADAVNWRFDVTNTTCPAGGACSASINSTKDLVHPTFPATGQTCRDHSQGWQTQPAVAYQPNTAAPLAPTVTPGVMGHPRDICHAVSVDGSCLGGPFGDGVWDREAYFRTNYPAWTNGDLTSRWRANTGLSASATRYEVYRWEIDNAGDTVDGQVVLGSRAVTGSLTSYGQPQCAAASTPTASVADRRRLSVAVVNCVGNNVRGNSSGVPVRRWIDVFLVEPSWDRRDASNSSRSQKDQIYVEIIGETASGSAGETAGSVIQRDMPYLIK